MNRQGLIMALTLPLASAAVAEGPLLQSPIDCDLTGPCYIQQYMDRQPGAGWHDYQCSTLSYNGHRGTDFALPNLKMMEDGVNVIAAAPGTVRGTRDDMPDTGWTADTIRDIGKRACGNGLVIEHADGWSTQYCHLKQGSIVVEKGQRVETGDVLGQVGMSGRTEFPHVHFSVRKHDVPIDPFNPDGVVECGVSADRTLWADPPAYQPGGLIDAGILTHVPEYDEIKEGGIALTQASPDAPALVLYGFAFGMRRGDQFELRLTAPNGNTIAYDLTQLPGDHAQAFRAIGKNLSTGRRWQKGVYIGTVSLKRADNIISMMTKEISVR